MASMVHFVIPGFPDTSMQVSVTLPGIPSAAEIVYPNTIHDSKLPPVYNPCTRLELAATLF